MNKTAIRKTAICYWSDEDKAYVVESPLFETIAGAGLTEKESWKVFDNLLADAYEAYLEGRVSGYDKAGRPAKGRMACNTDVKPETKQFIMDLAKNFQCSQGEIIDFLTFAYQRNNKNKAFSYVESTKGNQRWLKVCEKMHALKEYIDDIETELPEVFSYEQHLGSSSESKVKKKRKRA